jgi:hypothetical protein
MIAWAKEQIRNSQRSGEELFPIERMAPGAAHRTASLTYQKRNLEEGKCMSCPQPLDPRSHRYCSKHLLMARERKTPNRKRDEPGCVSWLYGQLPDPNEKRGSSKDRQKMRRIRPEGEALLKKVAKDLGFTYHHLRGVALGDRRSNRVMAAINRELDAIIGQTKAVTDGDQLE